MTKRYHDYNGNDVTEEVEAYLIKEIEECGLAQKELIQTKKELEKIKELHQQGFQLSIEKTLEVENLKEKLSEKDNRFYELADLVWNHFLAMDSKGNTGEGRDKTETQRVWDTYHDLVSNYKKNS